MARLPLLIARSVAALLFVLPAFPAPAADKSDNDVAMPVVEPGPSSAMPSISGLVGPAHAPGYPTTHRDDLVETKFGVAVPDPYRWLENDVRSDADVAAWVGAENRATQAYLATLPGRDILRQRMATLFDYERFGLPRKAAGRYFYTRNSGLQNQAPLYVREGLTGAERMLLDPNGLAGSGAAALAEWRASDDGRYLVYAVQENGSDWRTLHVIDVDTGKPLDDEVRWVKFSRLAWRADGAGFFYSRFDVPGQGDRAQSTLLNQRVYYHALGTPQSADPLIYATPDQPQLMHEAQVTDDGRWLVITSSAGTDARDALTLLSLAEPHAKPHRLVKDLDNEWTLAGSVGNYLYFRTDKNAPNGRLVVIDAEHYWRKPVEIVGQRSHALVAASLIGNRLVMAYVADGNIRAELIDLLGHPAGQVPLPGIGSAAGFSGRSGDPETFFRFSSFTMPGTIYRLNVETGKVEIFAQPHLAFDPAGFVTDQLSYASRDGTRIPLMLIRRKDVAEAHKPAPTLLYGYGGFNIAMTPGFSPTQLAWVEQGGVLAIANLRGGGEYGKAWHDAGRLSNKQNVFDDFIAAAEYLKSSGYTGANQLAVEGRSNGGLLVGAVVNQRPDLFAAALPSVGVMDMLRFDQFTAGRYWVDDYGSPEKEADFRNLLAYSPYHNVRSGEYPAIMVTTADTDDRVVPGHSFKYAAALQHAEIGDKPHLIRIATNAGHGAGRPTDKVIDETADMYSFAAYWTGLKVSTK